MRVLVVSDVVNRLLYSSEVKKIVGNIDLIISCGDLPCYYLDYLVSFLGKPLYYICGNHDRYEKKKSFQDDMKALKDFSFSKFDYNKCFNFGGCNLDEKSIKYKNLLISGLEGSFLYNRGEHQYTERQMRRKIVRLTPALIFNRVIKGRYLDILVTHASPRGIHDEDDLPHRGFESYLRFIKRFKPKYLLHGHIHLYDRNKERVTEYMGTKIINCYDYQILDLE